MGMKSFLLVALMFAAACGCPSSELGTLVSSAKYAEERNAACAAVEGCEPEFMTSVRVIEIVGRDEMKRLCESETSWGCYCPDASGCQTVFLLDYGPDRRDNSALHEMVHAALDAVGRSEVGHGPEFESALARAKTLVRD